ARATRHLQEMVEEPLVAGDAGPSSTLRRLPEPSQRGERARCGVGAGDVAAVDADRVRAEGEADRGDARKRRRGPAVGGQAGWRVGALPEEGEGALLEGIEERLDAWRGRVDAGLRAVTGTAEDDEPEERSPVSRAHGDQDTSLRKEPGGAPRRHPTGGEGQKL